MDEMAYSLLGANPHFGAPINPIMPDRLPGGSSSGSAVAVAAGLTDFAIGTDTGGSCRAPASFCGVIGIRPSYHSIPMRGVIPMSRSLDVLGWFARDIDCLMSVAKTLLPKDTVDAHYEQATFLSESFESAESEFLDIAQTTLHRLKSGTWRMASLGEDFLPKRSCILEIYKVMRFGLSISHGSWRISLTLDQA